MTSKRAGNGGDHLAGRLLEPALHLGEVLRRDPGRVAMSPSVSPAVVPEAPQLFTEHVPPQRLARL